TGRFMKVLPVLISVLLFSSLLEAFYFIPLHAKQLLKVNKNKKANNLTIPLFFIPMVVLGSLFLLMSEDINIRNTAKHTLYSPIFILIADFIERETFKSDIRKDKQFLLEIFE
ncbi:MAG: hypothetical protein MJK14_25425, partial [Rivularia sp. ALOHA_DT_140]|nr:hypothetical protein [Rivularia sp. ALOHA_DT_140]